MRQCKGPRSTGIELYVISTSLENLLATGLDSWHRHAVDKAHDYRDDPSGTLGRRKAWHYCVCVCVCVFVCTTPTAQASSSSKAWHRSAPEGTPGRGGKDRVEHAGKGRQ
jgi:hypothetical protein